MVNMASSIARGPVLSLTKVAVAVSHQCGDFSHASLVNIRSRKGLHQLNCIEYSCWLTSGKTRNPLTSVTWPHCGLRSSLWGCLLDAGIAQENKQVNLGQLMDAAYIFAIWYGRSISWSNWQLSQQGIRWPISHDCIAGLSVEFTEVTCFFKVHRLKYFHKIIKQAKKLKLHF